MTIAALLLGQLQHHTGDHMDWNDGGAWWMVTMMIVFAVIVVGVIIWAITVSSRSGRAAGSPSATSPRGNQSNARAILDERLARGEIDVAEYEQRRRLLD